MFIGTSFKSARTTTSVSYTHLDVYKRQIIPFYSKRCMFQIFIPIFIQISRSFSDNPPKPIIPKSNKYIVFLNNNRGVQCSLLYIFTIFSESLFTLSISSEAVLVDNNKESNCDRTVSGSSSFILCFALSNANAGL